MGIDAKVIRFQSDNLAIWVVPFQCADLCDDEFNFEPFSAFPLHSSSQAIITQIFSIQNPTHPLWMSNFRIHTILGHMYSCINNWRPRFGNNSDLPHSGESGGKETLFCKHVVVLLLSHPFNHSIIKRVLFRFM